MGRFRHRDQWLLGKGPGQHRRRVVFRVVELRHVTERRADAVDDTFGICQVGSRKVNEHSTLGASCRNAQET